MININITFSHFSISSLLASILFIYFPLFSHTLLLSSLSIFLYLLASHDFFAFFTTTPPPFSVSSSAYLILHFGTFLKISLLFSPLTHLFHHSLSGFLPSFPPLLFSLTFPPSFFPLSGFPFFFFFHSPAFLSTSSK